MAAISLMTRSFHDLAFSQEVDTNALAPRMGDLILYLLPKLLPIYYTFPLAQTPREARFSLCHLYAVMVSLTYLKKTNAQSQKLFQQ